jgi:ring-1,2-phenylacetyl-CoA epoxidase subunit PaaC
MAEFAPDEALFEYLLRLGDTSLVLGHRLSEWCGHAPALEEDIALTNIALDLIGQARLFLSYAGEIEGRGRSEDELAYLRDAHDFRNLLLVEQPNEDFARTIARQFLFDARNVELMARLSASRDERLAAIAAKALKEVSYHVRHTSEWMIRLGDGTDLSHAKIQAALDDLWMYTGEMFAVDEIDEALIAAGIGADPAALKPTWDRRVDEVLAAATLRRPEDAWMDTGGKRGRHTEHLGYLLAEMQFLQRAYPGATW